jgi:hypothetical protein
MNDLSTGIDDEDVALDSLYLLPLSLIPLETPGLQRVRLRKNNSMQSIVELFREKSMGSGQVFPSDLFHYFQNESGKLKRDIAILEKLSKLKSFDVYTLRLELGKLDINFQNFDGLKLSDRKRAELNEYMRAFTRPVIRRVYGGRDIELDSVDSIADRLTNPDVAETRKRLTALSRDLNIPLSELPAFLERFGSIFMSVSYFHSCLDMQEEIVPDLQKWIYEIKDSFSVGRDAQSMKAITGMHGLLGGAMAELKASIETFYAMADSFWENASQNSFREFENAVLGQHVAIGASLCALTVKTERWKEAFPNGGASLEKRYKFVTTELAAGLDQIRGVAPASPRAKGMVWGAQAAATASHPDAGARVGLKRVRVWDRP